MDLQGDNRKRSSHLTDRMIAKLEPYASDIYDLYWNWGLNFAEISETLGVASSASVYRFFSYKFGAKTREQQLKELKEKNTGRVWSEESKEKVRIGVQGFYDRNRGNLLNDDGTPKSNCPFKGVCKTGKSTQKDLDDWFEFYYGDVKEFLQKEYVDCKKSIDVISNETGFSRAYLTHLLQRLNIRIRDRNELSKGRTHIVSEQAKQNMKKAASKPETKKRRSEAQKRYWSTVPYEERLKRTRNGCITGFEANLKNTISSIELKVKYQLDSIGVKYIQQKRVYDKKHNRVYYFDFYLPDYKLVIECNGDYWHNLPERKQRDKDLKQFVENCGKSVLFLWESEICDSWFWVGDYIGR